MLGALLLTSLHHLINVNAETSPISPTCDLRVLGYDFYLHHQLSATKLDCGTLRGHSLQQLASRCSDEPKCAAFIVFQTHGWADPKFCFLSSVRGPLVKQPSTHMRNEFDGIFVRQGLWPDQAEALAGQHSFGAFPFTMPKHFGSVALADAECCPYATFPLPLPPTRQPPDMVFLVGAQKGGTTSLYQLLTMHPRIAAGTRRGTGKRRRGATDLTSIFRSKEPHLLSRAPHDVTYQDVAAYLDRWSSAPQDSLWLDASPSYMHRPIAACRIKAAFPDAKIIFALREPVARAVSQYRMERRRADETQAAYFLSLRDRVLNELDFLARKRCLFDDREAPADWHSCFKCYTDTYKEDNMCAPMSTLYHCPDPLCGALSKMCQGSAKCEQLNWLVMKGFYGAMLASWLRLFPKEQLFVVNMEDQVAELPRLFRFLRLPAVDLKARNVEKVLAAVKRHASNVTCLDGVSDVDDEGIRLLKEVYSHQNEHLYKLLGLLEVKFPRFQADC